MKNRTGECHICGKYKNLTFEHVPPKAAFNDKPVKLAKDESIVEMLTNPDRNPCDLNGLPYKSQQRGAGGYYLCDDCNNMTGAWYAKYYVDFVHNKAIIRKIAGFNINDALSLEIRQIHPLAVFKQIMVMFCDINPFCKNDEGLRKYLLEKENLVFDSNRYRVFMSLYSGGLQRVYPIFAIGTIEGKALLISEIVSPPYIFVLYLDLAEDIHGDYINGCEITNWGKYNYSDIHDFLLILPVKKCITPLPLSYDK